MQPPNPPPGFFQGQNGHQGTSAAGSPNPYAPNFGLSPQGFPTAQMFAQPAPPNGFGPPKDIPLNPYFIPPKMPEAFGPPSAGLPPTQNYPPLPTEASKPSKPTPREGSARPSAPSPTPARQQTPLPGDTKTAWDLPASYLDILKNFMIIGQTPTDSYVYDYKDPKRRPQPKTHETKRHNRQAAEQTQPKPLQPAPAPKQPQPDEAAQGPGKLLNDLIGQSLVRGKVLPPVDDQPAFVSGIFSAKGTAKKQELINHPSDHLKQPIQNSMIQSYINPRVDNMLDDLQELIKNSTSYHKAKELAGQGRFRDPDFLPNTASILGFGEGKGMSPAEAAAVPWLRPMQFFSGQFWIYRTIRSEDIQQGRLGDCYFLAAVSSIAEFPKRIERLFLRKEVDKRSIYVVALCHNGIWDDVVLDDKFPCHPATKRPVFSSSKNNDLWVLLMEKAWAKVNGGYRNISAGLTREALRALTGASCKTFFTDNKSEELWREILLADRSNFIITAASEDLSGKGGDEFIEKIGLCGSHAYSVLEAHEVDQFGNNFAVLKLGERPRGRVERLLKLRNPWGKGEWKGDWSDKDPRWRHPELARLRPEGLKEDGQFFISYNDFLQYFSDVQICYCYDDFKYSALKVQAPKDSLVHIGFKISTPGVYYLSLNQKITRAFPRRSNYAFSPLMFLVAEALPAGGFRYVANSMREDFENWVKADLKPGRYVVAIRAAWVSFVDEFSFSVYGLQKLSLQRLPPGALPVTFLSDALKHHARSDKSVEFFTFAKTGFPDIVYKLFDTKEGCGYVYFENRNAGVVANFTCDFRKSQNVRLGAPYSILNPQFTLEPKSSKVIVFEALKFPYVMQMQISASFQKQKARQDISQRVKEVGKGVQRLDIDGRPLNVWVHALQDADCLTLVYANRETQFKFVERIKFNLVAAHLESGVGDEVEVVVGPGKEKLVKVVRDEGAARFRVTIANAFCWVIPAK